MVISPNQRVLYETLSLAGPPPLGSRRSVLSECCAPNHLVSSKANSCLQGVVRGPPFLGETGPGTPGCSPHLHYMEERETKIPRERMILLSEQRSVPGNNADECPNLGSQPTGCNLDAHQC